jgi:hypothetical protein
MRFMNGLAGFVMSLDNPEQLKVAVETLGFGHLHLDVTVPRVVIFRDAILDLFAVELGKNFSSQARDTWSRLLNYVGGAIIYVKRSMQEGSTPCSRAGRSATRRTPKAATAWTPLGRLRTKLP